MSTVYFLSKVPLSGEHTLATGKEAIEGLRQQGLSYIYVNSQGVLRALRKDYNHLTGCYVYKKEV